jgi:hypothetical protein
MAAAKAGRLNSTVAKIRDEVASGAGSSGMTSGFSAANAGAFSSAQARRVATQARGKLVREGTHWPTVRIKPDTVDPSRDFAIASLSFSRNVHKQPPFRRDVQPHRWRGYYAAAVQTHF